MHLSNMAQSPQHWSRSRAVAVDNPFCEPPTVTKASGESRSRSVNTYMSYPRIPRRQSSLSASLSNDSNGPATSTRTPSLCDSLYQIRVAKRRQSGGKVLRDMGNQDFGITEDDPSITEVTRTPSSSIVLLLTCLKEPKSSRQDPGEQD